MEMVGRRWLLLNLGNLCRVYKDAAKTLGLATAESEVVGRQIHFLAGKNKGPKKPAKKWANDNGKRGPTSQPLTKWAY